MAQGEESKSFGHSWDKFSMKGAGKKTKNNPKDELKVGLRRGRPPTQVLQHYHTQWSVHTSHKLQNKEKIILINRRIL